MYYCRYVLEPTLAGITPNVALPLHRIIILGWKRFLVTHALAYLSPQSIKLKEKAKYSSFFLIADSGDLDDLFINDEE
jgi:hypothetical protein